MKRFLASVSVVLSVFTAMGQDRADRQQLDDPASFP